MEAHCNTKENKGLNRAFKEVVQWRVLCGMGSYGRFVGSIPLAIQQQMVGISSYHKLPWYPIVDMLCRYHGYQLPIGI